MATINQNTTDLQAILNLANSLPEKVDTSGTATVADIYTGKTATVNDQKITGTNPYNAANVDPVVTSALTALADKGVDTAGADLFDLAELIAAIEAGGAAVAYGSVTPTSNTYNLVVTHGLGVIPDVVMFWMNDQISNSSQIETDTLYFGLATPNDDIFSGENVYSTFQSGTTTYSSRYITGSGNLTTSASMANIFKTYGAPHSGTNETFTLGDNISELFLKASCTYHWIAIGGLA